MTNPRTRAITPDGTNTTTGTRTTGRHTQKAKIVEELQEIQNSTEARQYLEKTSLIVPPGESISPGLLATALHYVTEYKQLPKQAINAIRSVAFLLEELEVNALHETVRDSVTVQLDTLGNDLKDFVTDTTQRIDDHVDKKLTELSEATKDLVESVKAAVGSTQFTGGDEAKSLDYRRALLRPPPHVDPRLAAKEGIRSRQFLLDGITRDSKIGKSNAVEAKKLVNQALDTAGAPSHKARSALRQNKAGLLVEMETDAGAGWLAEAENIEALCAALGPGISFKQRPYNILAYNAPTTLDPGNAEHVREIVEANGIKEGGILSTRWVKPMNRRDRADQRTAHLILTLSNADDANRAILAGLTICNRRLRVAKSKKEPIRCMKCHNWNHVAGECIAKEDTCGTCGEKGHWTKDCTNKEKKRCVSCAADDHASWSRLCPTFLRKCEELDKRTPENNLPFFPSLEAWTWAATLPTSPQYATYAGPPPILPRGRNQQERTQLNKEAAPGGRPYERRSWNRPSSNNQTTHTDKPPFTPLPSFLQIPEETSTNTNSQPANSQDSMYV